MADEETKAENRANAPFWWPEAVTLIQLFLTVSIVMMGFYILRRLLEEGGLKIDQSVRDLIVFIFGIIFGAFKDVFGWAFGSSASGKKRDDAVADSLKAKDKLIASAVPVAPIAAGDPTTAVTTTTTTAVTTPEPEKPKETK